MPQAEGGIHGGRIEPFHRAGVDPQGGSGLKQHAESDVHLLFHPGGEIPQVVAVQGDVMIAGGAQGCAGFRRGQAAVCRLLVEQGREVGLIQIGTAAQNHGVGGVAYLGGVVGVGPLQGIGKLLFARPGARNHKVPGL